MKSYQIKTQIGLWLVIFLLSLLCQEQNAQAEIKLTKIWQVPTQDIYSAVFSPNDSLIFTTGSGGLWIYDQTTGEKVKELTYKDSVYHYFLFTKNPDEFLAARYNNTKTFYVDRIKISDWTVLNTIVFHTDENIGAAPLFQNSDEAKITMVCDYGVYIYESINGNLIKKITLKDRPFNPVITNDLKYMFYEISGDGKKAFGYLMRMDLESEKQSLIETNGTQSVLSPDGKYLAYHMAWATQPYNGRIINPNTLQEIWKTINPSSSFLFTKNSKALFIQGVYTDTLHHLIYRLNDEIKLFDILSIYKDWLKDISNFENYIISYDGGDYFLKLFGISGFSEVNNTTLENVQIVYPNPAEDYITVVNLWVDGHAIRIFDVFGKCVLNVGAIHELPLRIDVSTLPAGVYFVVISGKNYEKTSKIIIQK